MNKPAQQLKFPLHSTIQQPSIPKESRLDFLQQIAELMADYFTESQKSVEHEEPNYEQ